jgi:DNA-binding NarL/FixJ family response regulator
MTKATLRGEILPATERCWQVLAAVAWTGSYKGAAAMLGIAPRTVGCHLFRLYHDLGVDNTYAAMIVAGCSSFWFVVGVIVGRAFA